MKVYVVLFEDRILKAFTREEAAQNYATYGIYDPEKKVKVRVFTEEGR